MVERQGCCRRWELPGFRFIVMAIKTQFYLRQRGGGVDEGEPGVGVPAGLLPPKSICS